MFPVLVSLVVALAAAPAAAVPSKTLALQRVAKASPAVPPALKPFQGNQPLSLAVTDDRTGEDPLVLGALQEKGVVTYRWKSPGPVLDAARTMIEQTLSSWGVTLAAQSDFRMVVAIQELRIDEVPETFGSSYRASVKLRGGVFDPMRGGTPMGRVVTGTAKTTGPDRRAKLCNEALTAALEDALVQLATYGKADGPATVSADASDPNAVAAKVMLKELVRLKEAGLGETVLLGYVRQRRLTAPLTADDILQWKESGLPESVIHAAQEVR